MKQAKKLAIIYIQYILSHKTPASADLGKIETLECSYKIDLCP